MSNLQFQRATKRRAKARVAIDGPTGAGKTYTALIAATVLAEGGRVAVIDTERGSASLYSDEFAFDVLELAEFNPRNYIEAIEAAEAAGYAVVVVDSLSHAWEGEGGALDLVDRAAKRSQSGNNYVAWKDVTPLQRKLVDAMLQSKCHIVATMRSKMDYVQEKDERTGKTVIRKVGMAPVQRQGMEYEFTIVADMDTDHNLAVTKSRCKALADKVENKPDARFWKVFLDWLNSGEAAPAPAPKAAAPDVPPADERQYSEAEIGPDFDAPGEASAPEPPAAKKAPRPTPAMWAKYRELHTQAEQLGLAVSEPDPNVSTEQLAELGKALRIQVEQAIAAKAQPAANGNGNSKRPTNEQLRARVMQLAAEAKQLNLIGPAWTLSPQWTEAELINAGHSLKTKIAEAKARQPEARHA